MAFMNLTQEDTLKTIYESIDELNEQLPAERLVDKSPETRLLGDSGQLDSIGFVNFVAILEEKCAQRFGVMVSLIPDLQDENGANPFETLAKLAEHLRNILGRQT
jgi:acyl carrier protein